MLFAGAVVGDALTNDITLYNLAAWKIIHVLWFYMVLPIEKIVILSFQVGIPEQAT